MKKNLLWIIKYTPLTPITQEITRSSVPGTLYQCPTYTFFIFCIWTTIFAVIAGIIPAVHYFLVFLVIIYYEVIFLGTLSVGYPEKIYFCLYRVPGGTKVNTVIVFSSGFSMSHRWCEILAPHNMLENLFRNSQRRIVFFFSILSIAKVKTVRYLYPFPL